MSEWINGPDRGLDQKQVFNEWNQKYVYQFGKSSCENELNLFATKN